MLLYCLDLGLRSAVSVRASACRLPGMQQGRICEMQRARDLMERLVKVASPLGLYAEDFDVETGRHLGNFSPGVLPTSRWSRSPHGSSSRSGSQRSHDPLRRTLSWRAVSNAAGSVA